MSETSSFYALEQRIDALERQTHRLKRLLFVFLVMVLALGSAAGTIAQQRALSFSNSTGKVRVDATGFALYDSAGHKRLTLGFNTANEPGMYIWDKNGVDRLGAYMSAKGQPVFRLTDAAKNDRAFFGLTGDAHEPRISLEDASGNERFYVGLSTANSALLTMSTTSNKEVIRMQGSDAPFLRFSDGTGTTRGYAGIFTDGSAGFASYNESGTQTWTAP
jgi:hypothetical protein